MKERIKELESIFVNEFKSSPTMVKAPGRINLIGEHTDYNMGYVLPAAIDKAAYVAIDRSSSDRCKLIALDLNESYEFSIGDALEPIDVDWVNYFLGVVNEFTKKGHLLKGFNMVFTSDVPLGAGLSSSAALESSFGFGLNELFKTSLSITDIALIGQTAEHEFAGVKCGIMDQFASCFGKKDQAILLDCKSLEHSYISSDLEGYQLVLIDTKVKHNLADSQYNIRRNQCEAGVALLNKKFGNISSLRDATMKQLDELHGDMELVIYNRCKYVIEENTRVLEACEALKNKEVEKLGDLLFKTHQGLSKLYEVSCKELDALVSYAIENENIIGARMMGGGFGGCTLNLVKNENMEETIKYIVSQYKEYNQINANYYIVEISDGAMKI
ncbi:MAG: galactokinase [Saprospiraceae bacterium]|jgi:galactokinase